MLGSEVYCTTSESRLRAFISIFILVVVGSAVRMKISLQYKLHTFKTRQQNTRGGKEGSRKETKNQMKNALKVLQNSLKPQLLNQKDVGKT